MILCDIKDACRYAGMSPQMGVAIEWVSEHFADPFEAGTRIIGKSAGGYDIIVKSEEPALMPREKVSLEAHRHYIDIQLPLRGPEKMGWAPVERLRFPRSEYDSERDIVFYGDAASSIVNVAPGQMAVFFPEDAHAPNIGLGNHRKLIVKVPVV